MKKSLAAIAAAFALVSVPAMAEEEAVELCDRATERPLNIFELSKPIPQGQAVAFLLQLDKDSPVWEELKDADNVDLGDMLNQYAGEHLTFDPHSAYRLNRQELFEEIPYIVVHVCQMDGAMNVLEINEALKDIEGVLHAAPDSTLEPISADMPYSELKRSLSL